MSNATNGTLKLRRDREKRIREIVKNSYPLKNDIFMLFAQHKDFCQEFLRVILQDNKLVVLDNEIQKNLPTIFSKDVVLDMFCQLGDGSIVNVEIQLTDEKGHERRIFLYASKIKSYLTEVGEKYKDLKDIITIYLTKEDIFKMGSTVYKVNMDIVSDQGIIIKPWEAGLKVYYVNTEGLTNKTINEYLQLLLDQTTFSDKYKITSKIKKENYEKGGQTVSSELRELMEEERAEGRAEGMAEGLAEGLAKGMNEGLAKGMNEGLAKGMSEGILKGKIESFLSLVKKGLLELSVAAKELGMSESQFEKLVNG